MIDTAYLTKIKRMSDAELDSHVTAAWNAAYCESYGRDYEARADAIQEYEALAREQRRRRRS